LSKPVAVKLSMPCPYCHTEVYCILTKRELKEVMKGFKMQLPTADKYIMMKVDERGYAKL